MFQHLLPVPPGISYEWVNKSPMQWQIDVKGCYKTKFLVRLQIFWEKLLQHFNSLNILNSLVCEFQSISIRFDLEDNWRHIPARGFDRTRIISTRGFLEGKISTSWLEVPPVHIKIQPNTSTQNTASSALRTWSFKEVLRTMGLENDADLKRMREELKREKERVARLEREVKERMRREAQKAADSRTRGRWPRIWTQSFGDLLFQFQLQRGRWRRGWGRRQKKRSPEGGALDSGDPGFDLTSVQVQNL